MVDGTSADQDLVNCILDGCSTANDVLDIRKRCLDDDLDVLWVNTWVFDCDSRCGRISGCASVVSCNCDSGLDWVVVLSAAIIVRISWSQVV